MTYDVGKTKELSVAIGRVVAGEPAQEAVDALANVTAHLIRLATRTQGLSLQEAHETADDVAATVRTAIEMHWDAALKGAA